MDLSQQLQQLESTRDWQGLAEALEQAIEQSSDDVEKSRLFLKLGKVMTEKLLQGPRALRHFQTAWKLQPEVVEPLIWAQNIYWELGKFKMVATVLQRSLESATEEQKGILLCELVDVLSTMGNYDVALESYAQALRLGGAIAERARPCLEDMSIDEASHQDRIDEILALAAEASTGSERAEHLLRAARIAKRYTNLQYEQLLLQAYQADCDNKQASSLYEELMVAEGRLAQVLETQREMLENATPTEGPRLAFRYGVRWATRHQNVELGARLLEQAVLGDPTNDAAFTFLRELWGSHEGDWAKVVGLADQISELHQPPPFVMAEAGRLCWLQLGDLMRARRWFERLSEVDADHPTLAAFEAQIGERLSEAAPEPTKEPAPEPEPEPEP
ncbi:MAG: hypothetical protein RIF41_29235 [Polyangiaceae bacterium]